VVNQTLHNVWRSLGLVHYIHFPGLLPRNEILPRAKFTLRLSVTARHSSSGRQRKFAASYKEWNYGTFEQGATYIIIIIIIIIRFVKRQNVKRLPWR